MKSLYEGGADPVIVLQDLLELVHFLTRLKLASNAGEGDPAVEGDRVRGAPLAARLGVAALARAWQLLLKGLEEAQAAPSPLQAVEMVLVRLAYVADLPAPAEIIKTLDGAPAGHAAIAASPPRVSHTVAPSGSAAFDKGSSFDKGSGGPSAIAGLAVREAPAPAVSAAQPQPAQPQPQSFLHVVELFEKHHEALLRAHLWAHVHLVRFEQGRIELRPTEAAPRELPNRLGTLLTQWTGQRWVVSISSEIGEPSLKEQAEARAQSLRSEAAQDPLVRAVLDAFPGARIESVREIAPASVEPMPDADELPEGDENS